MARRRWEIKAGDYVDDTGVFHEAAFREAVREALLEIEVIGERFGYAVSAAPLREPETFRTLRWVFQVGTVPTARYVEPGEGLLEPAQVDGEDEPGTAAGDGENAAEEPVAAASEE